MDLKNIIETINESDDFWKKILEDKVCKIEKKECDNAPPIMRTTATIDGYLAKEIFEAISIISNRLKWDKSFTEFVMVEQNIDEGHEILYMVFKVSLLKC